MIIHDKQVHKSSEDARASGKLVSKKFGLVKTLGQNFSGTKYFNNLIRIKNTFENTQWRQDQNIATGKMSQAITSFYFFDYFDFSYIYH